MAQTKKTKVSSVYNLLPPFSDRNIQTSPDSAATPQIKVCFPPVSCRKAAGDLRVKVGRVFFLHKNTHLDSFSESFWFVFGNLTPAQTERTNLGGPADISSPPPRFGKHRAMICQPFSLPIRSTGSRVLRPCGRREKLNQPAFREDHAKKANLLL